MNYLPPVATEVHKDDVKHDFTSCFGCGLCGLICPQAAIVIEGGVNASGMRYKRPILDPAKCVHCGRCNTVCASGSILQLRFPSILAKVRSGEIKNLVFFCRNLNQAHPTPLETGDIPLEMPLTFTRLYPQLSLVETAPGVQIEEVRCTGRLGARLFLDLFSSGLQGALVFACPPHDCQYGKGVSYAQLHGGGMKSVLEAYGVDSRRLEVLNIQPRTREEVAGLIGDFVMGRMATA